MPESKYPREDGLPGPARAQGTPEAPEATQVSDVHAASSSAAQGHNHPDLQSQKRIQRTGDFRRGSSYSAIVFFLLREEQFLPVTRRHIQLQERWEGILTRKPCSAPRSWSPVASRRGRIAPGGAVRRFLTTSGKVTATGFMLTGGPCGNSLLREASTGCPLRARRCGENTDVNRTQLLSHRKAENESPPETPRVLA